MKIDMVELRSIYLPLKAPFVTSFGTQDHRNAVLITVHADGLSGWGECVAAEEPFYAAETSKTCWYMLENYHIPALLNGTISGNPYTFAEEVKFIRGHNMARATLEAALWDLEAQRRETPLWKLFGGVQKKLQTGVSVGIQPSTEALVDVVSEYLQQGYRRIKVKVKPGVDIKPLEAIRKSFPDIPLMADANSAYTLNDIDTLQVFDKFNLMMVEQPLAPTDLVDHAELQRRLQTPICLDESLDSVDQLHAAIALKSCRVVNVKQGRIGGPSQAKRFNDICRDSGMPVWCGGMLETGIGRALNIALATMDNFTIPGDISGSDRYWHEDIIDPTVTVNPDGTIDVTDSVGLGYEPKLDFIQELTQQFIRIKP